MLDRVNDSGKVCGDVVERLVVHQVDRLDLERLDEALAWTLSWGLARRLTEPTSPCWARRLRCRAEAHRPPRSE